MEISRVPLKDRSVHHDSAQELLPRDTVAVIADAHLGGPSAERGDALDRFEALLVSLENRVDSLVLLGDLFEVWVGLSHLQESWHERIRAALGRAADRGLELHYIEGNRDFLVSKLPDSPFTSVTREMGMRIGGSSVLFTHGDLIDTQDRQYRRWCALSRSLPLQLAARLIPGTLGRRWIRRIDERFRRSNLIRKARFPEEDLRRELASRRREGWDRILLGHFHRSWETTQAGSSLRILPAWIDEGRWLLMRKTGATLRKGPW